jgi:hypothetical protein
MTFITVRCLHCHSEPIVKRGKTARYNATCARTPRALRFSPRLPQPGLALVKQTIVDMSLNASGIRDTAGSCGQAPTLYSEAIGTARLLGPQPPCGNETQSRRRCYSA